MAPFPAEEIERIIDEEILRGESTKLWTTPQARRRYQNLLMERIVGTHDDRIPLLRMIFDAHYELAPFCTDRTHIFAFSEGGHRQLHELLRRVRDVITAVLDVRDRWAPDALLSPASGELFLTTQLQRIQDELERAARAKAAKGAMGMHSGRAVELDQTLQVSRYVLLSHAEGLEFDAQYGMAQEMLRRSSPLFYLPADTPVH